MDTIKILIVDDMRIISELIASLLSELNEPFQFIYADNGKEAYKIALASMPDLIIMDWEMPVMSGYDALMRMKKDQTLKDIPVIISSAFDNSDTIRLALEGGAIDYVRKPIDSIELVARVRSVLTLSSTYKALREQSKLLSEERSRNEKLIRGYLPEVVVDEIMHNGYNRPKRYKEVSILFADLVDFTSATNKMSCAHLFNELNDIFPVFDEIMQRHGCMKIKTIGDAYMASCGFPVPDSQHALKLARAAEDMMDFLRMRNNQQHDCWRLRIGICSGDIYAGLIGKDYFRFDVFGDTVNMAARMQQHSDPMQINVAEKTYLRIKNHYNVIERVPFKLKGKGVQRMYFLHHPIVADEQLCDDSIVEYSKSDLVM